MRGVPARAGALRLVRAVARPVSALATALLLLVFRTWQLLASPTYGQTCRFYPTCSAYGVEAVRTHGPLRGLWLTLRRLLRCHPWNPGGVDPVPSADPLLRSEHNEHDDRTADLADHRMCAPSGRRAA